MLGSGNIWLVGSRVASVGNDHHHHFNPTCSGMLALKSGLRFAIRVLVVPFFGHLKMVTNADLWPLEVHRYLPGASTGGARGNTTGFHGFQEVAKDAKRWQKIVRGAKRWQKMARGGWWRFSGEQPSQQTVSPHSRDICGLELRYNKTPWLNTKFTSKANLTELQQGRNKERLEHCCDKLDV